MTRCKRCKRKVNKLMVDVYTCKCSLLFCANHLHDHKCSFDHKKEEKQVKKEYACYKVK